MARRTLLLSGGANGMMELHTLGAWSHFSGQWLDVFTGHLARGSMDPVISPFRLFVFLGWILALLAYRRGKRVDCHCL